MDKQFFAGANTPNGFFSYFNYIFNSEDTERVFILKGGSGVGKSTLMNRFAKHFQEKGCTVERICCASDEESLDGVTIPSLGLVMMDGTAPHMTDPVLPGALEVLVNLGDYLDNGKLKEHKNEIAKLLEKKSRLYQSAYGYMKSAGCILELSNTLYDRLIDKTKLYQLSESLAKNLFPEEKGKGTVRKLFAEAFTANGFVDYSDSILDGKILYDMDRENHCLSSELLGALVSYGLKRGYSLECYYSTMEPEKVKHFVVKDTGLAVTSRSLISGDEGLQSKRAQLVSEKTIALNSLLHRKEADAYNELLAQNNLLFNQILCYAAKELEKTKEQHHVLEKIYSRTMDFTKVDACFKGIISAFGE